MRVRNVEVRRRESGRRNAHRMPIVLPVVRSPTGHSLPVTKVVRHVGPPGPGRIERYRHASRVYVIVIYGGPAAIRLLDSPAAIGPQGAGWHDVRRGAHRVALP